MISVLDHLPLATTASMYFFTELLASRGTDETQSTHRKCSPENTSDFDGYTFERISQCAIVFLLQVPRSVHIDRMTIKPVLVPLYSANRKYFQL